MANRDASPTASRVCSRCALVCEPTTSNHIVQPNHGPRANGPHRSTVIARRQRNGQQRTKNGQRTGARLVYALASFGIKNLNDQLRHRGYPLHRRTTLPRDIRHAHADAGGSAVDLWVDESER